MATRSVGGKRASVTVDVSDGLIRGVKRRLGVRAPEATPNDLGSLTVLSDLPEVDAKPPNIEESIRFWSRTVGSPTKAGSRQAGGVDLATPRPDSELQRRVDTWAWYQTIELPDGIVTPGVYDHRRLVPHYGIPASLEGMRVLDVASSDGFWAFEFERRGAAEVVSVDVARKADRDWPPGLGARFVADGLDAPCATGFEIAKEALGSKVQRYESSLYDLDPAQLGTFDFVHASDILLHLESPIGALQAIRRMCSGQALIVDCIDRTLEGQTIKYLGGGWRSGHGYYLPSLDTLAQQIFDGEFADVQLHTIYNLAAADARMGHWRASFLATVTGG
jgi:tRNA (mo5U34)-methyltransferase